MGLFGRKTVTTPTAAPPPPQRTGCCASISRALCSGVITTILFCIFGLSICGLVGRTYYWIFYRANISDPGSYWISGGWLDFADRDLGGHSLKDANFGLWIIGIISAACLAASAIIAFAEFWVSVTGNAGRHSAGLAFPMGIILTGILLCYIIAAVIVMDSWSFDNLGTKYRVWPSWGWVCAIVAGVLWFLVGSFAACIGPKYGRAKYTNQTAEGYPVEQHYPTTPVAGAAGAGAGVGAAAGKPKRGLFGRNKVAAPAAPPAQNYTAQPFNADQAPRDVEMGNAGVPHNGHHGAAGEGLAAGGGAGLGAAAAARHHDQQKNQNAAPAQQKRGLFGRKKATTPATTNVGDTAADQPSYADRPQGVSPSAPPVAIQGAPPQAGGPTDTQPGGAWAGSRLANQEPRTGGAWTGSGQAPTAAGVDAPAGTGAMPAGADVSQPARAGSAGLRKKSGIFSFYH